MPAVTPNLTQFFDPLTLELSQTSKDSNTVEETSPSNLLTRAVSDSTTDEACWTQPSFYFEKIGRQDPASNSRPISTHPMQLRQSTNSYHSRGLPIAETSAVPLVIVKSAQTWYADGRELEEISDLPLSNNETLWVFFFASITTATFTLRFGTSSVHIDTESGSGDIEGRFSDCGKLLY